MSIKLFRIDCAGAHYHVFGNDTETALENWRNHAPDLEWYESEDLEDVKCTEVPAEKMHTVRFEDETACIELTANQWRIIYEYSVAGSPVLSCSEW